MVLPNLYIGSYDDADNESELKENGITHVLSLIGSKLRPFEWVKYKRIPMNDYGRTDIKGVLKNALDFIEQGVYGDNRVLIHCQSGQNRSATVVIAFLMMSRGQTLYVAHKTLKRLRPIVQVNVKYADQLLKLEKELFHGMNSLPVDWMEPDGVDLVTGDVFYKYENLDTIKHRLLFQKNEK